MRSRKRKREGTAAGTQLRDAARHPYRTALSFTPMGTPELRLYRAMREAIPVLDAAILKLVRLTGGFDVRCSDRAAETGLRDFLARVPCGRGQTGIDSFLDAYLDSLLTCGRAVGEMVLAGATAI